ncbi:hypothetical protein GWI33_006028 [Rhynchophorus ferrugineus]|uniref:protein-tyrosine-phosphatase n=1 Tax=Rhynchophorus ferrugineus TaxID=354439 RepID=A0A834IXW6_RHYFE|nr:hypothetical protein GWI33_006028 [Rhynchophorus ferrugineus]
MDSPPNYSKKERNFLELDLKDQSTLSTDTQPVLVVQSPKTPTLSRKLKAVSLDSEPQPQSNTLEVSRDVFSMPNTPKRQVKHKLSCDLDDGIPKGTLAPSFTSNLKKFPSNNSISGSQTLKTLPEINALQDFSDCPIPEPQKVRAKGLLERRGSNASLTIDLGSTQSIPDIKSVPFNRLNTAKSVSNLYLSSTSSVEKCAHAKKSEVKVNTDRRKSQETCGNCTIYESVPKMSVWNSRCQNLKRCSYCSKSRRKSLSNENLYVPHCRFCESENKESENKHCKGINQREISSRQPDLEDSQYVSDDLKLHLKNIEYLKKAGNMLSVLDLKGACERTSTLHQEFWEVPINLPEKCYVSGSQSKNRYNGIIPNEHSRVLLSPNNGYIHANFIKGPDYIETAYIATQGPLSNTCIDFWEMVWYSQCKCIVMLTNLVEKGKNKCELYFPLGKKTDISEATFLYIETVKQFDKFTFDQKNPAECVTEIFEFEEKNEVTFGKYHIKFVSQRELDECQIRLLELKKTDTNVEPRVIHHYWYNKWPDHNKAPPEQVLKIAIDVLSIIDGKQENNEIVDLNLNASEHSDCEDISTNILSSNENGSRFTFNEAIEASNSCTALESTNQIEICQEVNNIPISTNSSMDIESYHGEVDYTETTYTTRSNDCSTMYCEKVDVKTETFYSSTNQNNFSFSTNLQNKSNKETSDIDHRISLDDQNTYTCDIRHQSTSYHERSACRTDVPSEPSTSNPRSREGSISDFNKETLSNRCSLDSKLGHLNKTSGFKSQLKREMYPLKPKPGINNRKKSTEHVKLPIVVHCSAGIGRTGCFLAILNGIQQLRRSNKVDILAILCSLRLNRGGMVQTAEQYELIHRVLSLYCDTL